MNLWDSTLATKLPVSGLDVAFRAPDGNDDLAILEAAGSPVHRALEALGRMAHALGPQQAGVESGRSLWARLTVTDFETALLGLRRFLLGDRLPCIFRCPVPGCGQRMAPDFSIGAFLAQVKPRIPKGLQSSNCGSHWFVLTGIAGAKFRLPLVQDQLEVIGRPRARALLAARCIEADGLSGRQLARIERAMESLAPLVSRPLTGNCPECEQAVSMPLHVPKLVTDELRLSAVGVHEEIHAIAEAYHWDEVAILAMPQGRRQAYAEMIRRHKQRAS